MEKHQQLIGIYVGLAIVATCIILAFVFKNWPKIVVVFKRLNGTAKIIDGQLNTKQHLYVIEMQVRVDGKIVGRFPSEIYARSRRAAKFEAEKRITVTTNTVAQKKHILKYNKQ